MSEPSFEFRVFSDRLLDMHGKPLAHDYTSIASQLYQRLQRAAADADGAPEFVFAFRRMDYGLSINEEVQSRAAKVAQWQEDATYRVAMLPTGRGRLFQLIRIHREQYANLSVDRAYLPSALYDQILAKDAYQPGLVLIAGAPRSWRTSTAVAIARHISVEHHVHTFLVEKSPAYVFSDDETYLTQIIGDNQAAATLAALEHRAGNKRVVFVDNAVTRNLAQETLLLATKGFFVLAVVDTTPEWPVAGPIETFAAAAGNEYSRVETQLASVLQGVIVCDASKRDGLKRGLTWHPLKAESRELLIERNYDALNRQLAHANADLDAIAARVGNVTSIRPRD